MRSHETPWHCYHGCAARSLDVLYRRYSKRLDKPPANTVVSLIAENPAKTRHTRTLITQPASYCLYLSAHFSRRQWKAASIARRHLSLTPSFHDPHSMSRQTHSLNSLPDVDTHGPSNSGATSLSHTGVSPRLQSQKTHNCRRLGVSGEESGSQCPACLKLVVLPSGVHSSKQAARPASSNLHHDVISGSSRGRTDEPAMHHRRHSKLQTLCYPEQNKEIEIATWTL
jgi:hypothetical protein